MFIVRRVPPPRFLVSVRAFASKPDPQTSNEQIADRINEQTSKLIKQIESKNPGNNGSPLKEYVNSIIESENFKNLKAELSKFSAERAKATEEYSKSFSERLSRNAKELKKSVTIASNLVNDVTGYTKIIQLQNKISQNEKNLRNLRNEITQAKYESKLAMEEQSSSQKHINELLERKHNWNTKDLEQFTELYKNGHELELSVEQKSAKVTELEQREDEMHNELIQSIMERYHEEQVWSDKIRQFSTWGTILIMGVNLLLVLLVQLVFEPWKRYRLLSSFELKVKDLFETQGMENWGKLKTELEVIEHKLANFEQVEGLLPENYTWESIKQWGLKLRGLLFGGEIYKLNVSSAEFTTFFGAFSSLFLFLGVLISRLLI
ncbi:hypothetical protein OGAPHI_000976 [Ogataea philodendri]|uniref:Sensitive to high expression protein 9, mitochondrial n=1 Tax=Ogataea philodendri TaxID=1378263 RepID=A0A9P8T9W0_9ASCO|nr:uncharacterized protein OGAPHI_000976 [Ogataea philodendri]KAH3670461.1 hypothetical protein OGAPHI_000976 [Ogataea philodendri]